MVKHVVMWKLKDEAEGKSKKENAQIIKRDLEALLGVIKEIKAIEVGINEIEAEGAFDAVLVSEFENFEDLNKYQVNENHRKVASYIAKVRVDRKVVDYQM